MFIPQTRLSKELKFGVIFKAALLSSFVSAAVSVGLALSGFGYWTIILASLVAAAVNLGALWILAPWRITIQYDRRIARELVSYGKHLFLTTIFTFFVLNIDNAGVAYLLGTAALGYYALAFKWANVPVNFLSRVAAQVMTPTYVLLRESLDRLRKGYLETVKMITIVSLPVYVGLLVMADEFVSLALGPTWLPIVLALRILCVMGILRGLTEPGAYLFMAIGKSRLVAVSTGVHLAILAILLAPGLYYGGIAGAAAAVAVAYGLNAIIVQRFVNREIGTRWSDLWHLVRNLVLGGLAMAASLFTLRILFPASAVLFLASISASLGVYLLLLRTLEGNLFADYLRQILGARRA